MMGTIKQCLMVPIMQIILFKYFSHQIISRAWQYVYVYSAHNTRPSGHKIAPRKSATRYLSQVNKAYLIELTNIGEKIYGYLP